MREDYNNGCTEATTSCTSTSPHGGYNRGNDLYVSLSLSLSLSCCHSLYSYALYTNLKSATTTTFMFSLSHIYTYMTFGLFTHVSLPIGRTDRNRVLDHPVLPIFSSGGTCFPTEREGENARGRWAPNGFGH